MLSSSAGGRMLLSSTDGRVLSFVAEVRGGGRVLSSFAEVQGGGIRRMLSSSAGGRVLSSSAEV